MTVVFIRRGEFVHRDTNARGEDDVKTKAEIGARHLQAKEAKEYLTATTRS